MSKLPDVFREGQQKNGWKLFNGEQGLPESLTCDVAIIGTGAGAGITAELLTQAGLDVILIEEGPLRTSSDFNQKETEAYTDLYQESAARANIDNSVTILQGRCVGGTTVINWTSSFRTPQDTLKFWQDNFGLADITKESMAPYFDKAEARLNILPWAAAPNANNELLRTGATKLGIEAHVIPRNVKGCWNLGSCGMGCPTNAKQSMLVTTIPAALTAGARLYYQTRAEKLEIKNGEVQALVCSGIRTNGDRANDKQLRIVAKHYVVSGGAINSPALLKRSDTPDPHGLIGTRTFLHPVSFSSAVYNDKVEATPMHPGLMGVLLGGIGGELAERFKNYPHTQMLLSLMRDGFHPEAAGGTVMLNIDGSPLLNYKLTPYVLDGFRRSFLAMAEMQFAAGAQKVLPYHASGRYYTSWAEAKEAINGFEMVPFKTGAGSAHVMGGCRISGKEELGVVQADGTHWHVKNLSVHDGSLFPTSVGANPQLSIYGLTNRLATQLAKRLSGKDVSLA